MIRYECFEWLAPQMTDQLVVTSLSGQRVEWGHLSKRDADLTLGSMGNALAVGIGVALALPHRKVFVFESDGSLLLSLFNLPTLANLNPSNLAVLCSTIKPTAAPESASQPRLRVRRILRPWRKEQVSSIP